MHVRAVPKPDVPIVPAAIPPRHSPPRTHVWLGWRGCTPSQPLCPPRGSHPQAGDTQALGAVQPPPHLINYFKRLRVSSSGQEIRSCSWEPSSPTSLLPQGTTWRGGGPALSPIFRSKSHHLQPHKGGPGALCVSPPAQRSPQGHPGQQHHPGCSGDTGSPRLSPVMAGGGHTEAEGMPGSAQQRGGVPVGDSAPQKWVGEDEAPACRLSTLMNYTGLQVPGQVSGERSQRGSPPPDPLLPENLRPGLRDRLSN